MSVKALELKLNRHLVRPHLCRASAKRYVRSGTEAYGYLVSSQSIAITLTRNSYLKSVESVSHVTFLTESSTLCFGTMTEHNRSVWI